MEAVFKATIDRLLMDRTRSLIAVYFDIQQLGEEKYGPNTVVLMEVGSFFEIYGIDDGKNSVGKPKELAEILNLQLTRQNKSILENSVDNPLMAGFPSIAFDRYITKLTQLQRYTIILIKQRGTPPQVSRYLDSILSPGVNFEYTLNHEANFVAAVAVDYNAQVYSVGYSAIDITTGRTYVFEIHGTKEDATLALDELFTTLRTYRTAEIILTLNTTAITQQTVVNYLELEAPLSVQLNHKHLTISYQNDLFREVYKIQSLLAPIEYLNLERKPLASEALGLLLEFVIEHDATMVRALTPPTVLDTQRLLYLGNTPLEQLNIMGRSASEELTVEQVVDYTTTSMGKRLLHERLLHPITNVQELKARYDVVEVVQPFATELVAELKSIYDLERLLRRIQLQRLHPFELAFLHDSMVAINRIIVLLKSQSLFQNFSAFLNDQASVQQCVQWLEHTFLLDTAAQWTQADLATSIFQPGVHPALDQLVEQQSQLEAKLDIIRATLVQVCATVTGKEAADYVQLKQFDKEGHYFTITKNRYALMAKQLADVTITIDGTEYAVRDFTFKQYTTHIKVTADIITTISNQIIVVQSQIIASVKELFLTELIQANQKFTELLQQCIEQIGRLDVAVSTSQAALQLHLTRPELLPEADTNTLQLQGVRHLLVEAREDSGIYVPNDISLGPTSPTGLLLYGINSSGKSSLMKSIGICIILAQAGIFVPAQQMRFTIFYELFTRITAKDNLAKGLSSFAVEMIELKNIFNRCSAHSLVLGDEISHSTETTSALALVSAAILQLVQVKVLFVFATHLHQLQTIPQLQALTTVVSQHLATHYDVERDTIVFERILQEGTGDSMYGLEFAQSLHLKADFLTQAKAIRQQLAQQYEDVEILTKQQRSKYNPRLLLISCAICHKTVEDTHHIKPQQLADTTGYIGHVPKDHRFNLLPLCKGCHQKVHQGKIVIEGFVMTSKGLQLGYTTSA